MLCRLRRANRKDGLIWLKIYLMCKICRFPLAKRKFCTEKNAKAADERAKQGMFLSFQNPLEVPGITLKGFIRSTLQQRGGKRVPLWEFNKQFEAAAKLLQMDPAYGDRDLNVGFSGGEKKKAEIIKKAKTAGLSL